MTALDSLVVLPEAIQQIEQFGKLKAPHEACGILFRDTIVLECNNESLEPEDSYILTVEEIVRVLEDYEGSEPIEELVIWHTHPNGHIGPSRGDMKSRISGIRYLVVSLPNGESVQY